MQINIEEINSYTREMSVQVPWTQLKHEFNQNAKKFSKKVQLQGFRPGKVPMKVLLKHYKSSLEADFIKHALNKYYLKALKEKELIPVNKAEVGQVDFEYTGELTFTAKFEIEPKIKLPKLNKKAFDIQKTNYIHDQEDVDNVIRDLRRKHATIETVETGAVEGHFVLADLQQLDERGLPIIGKKLTKQYIKVDGGVISDENLKKLQGVKIEDKIRMHLPENARGKMCEYEVTVINVEREVLPEINAEFIQKVDPDAKTFAELQANVAKRIEENYAHRSQVAYERQLADALIEKVNPEFPPSMVESYLDHMIEDLKQSEQPGVEKLDEDKVRDTYRATAERNMKWFLVRKAIIKDQALEVTKEAIQTEVQRLIDRSAEQAKEIEKYYKKPSNRTKIEDGLMERKILDYLQQFAKLKAVDVKTKDLRQQEAHDQ